MEVIFDLNQSARNLPVLIDLAKIIFETGASSFRNFISRRGMSMSEPAALSGYRLLSAGC